MNAPFGIKLSGRYPGVQYTLAGDCLSGFGEVAGADDSTARFLVVFLFDLVRLVDDIEFGLECVEFQFVGDHL